MEGPGQEGGKVGVPLRRNAHPVGHFVAHGKGQADVGNLGIHTGLSRKPKGHAGNAHGGVHIAPAQLLHRLGGTGKHGIMPLLGEILEALSRNICQFFLCVPLFYSLYF